MSEQRGKFDRAVALYVKLEHNDVFELIRKHSLYESVADKVLELMELDHEEAVKLFLDKMAQGLDSIHFTIRL